MKESIGIWIDHRLAVLVRFSRAAAEIQKFRSRAAISPRGEEPTTPKEPASRLRRQRSLDGIDRFYDRVIEAVGDAAFVALAGPAGAKDELRKRMHRRKGEDRIVSITPCNKTTDGKLVEYFREILAPATKPVRALKAAQEKSRRISKSRGPETGRPNVIAEPSASKRRRGPATKILASESPKARRAIQRGTGQKNLYANMPGARKER
jgi:hypothetical protein